MALTPGKVVVIGSNVPHSGKAITDCRILDVFQPVREDYRD
jgi:quercetin dioxygenase-like cupin family protein